MIGNDAFCPKSGEALSEGRHYDDRGRARRVVESTDVSETVGTADELRTGAVRSSTTAVLRYFRRSHRRHGPPDDELYRRAAVAVQRLKSAASGRQAWDCHVWYALQVHLDRRGFDVDWMDVHAALRCPHCHGRLKYAEGDCGALRATCATSCRGPGDDSLGTVRRIVTSLYGEAFPDEDPPEAETLLSAE